MKKRLKIGIDIDGVICDIMSSILPLIKTRYGTSLKKKDIYRHEIHEVLGVSERAFATDVFKDTVIKINHPAIKDAASYINRLYRKHTIVLVTSRPEIFNPITKKWLAKHKIKFHALINIHKHKYTVLDGFDFFIDDHLKEVIYASSVKNLNVLLFDQPWNRSFNSAGTFTRIKSWKKIYSLIEKTTDV